MSRYVNLDQIIADIFDKWGCDPAYYVGVSGADAHEAKLDADLIEFLRSKPYIEITRCGECETIAKEIDYDDCSNVMLKMWMDNVLTDGEYNRIMEKLNRWEKSQ